MLEIILSLVPATIVPEPVPTTAPSALQDEAVEAEYEQKKTAAGDDVDKLAELARWCKENGLSANARSTWERILELDSEHVEAHEALRHHHYDGKWFKSYVELSRYRREEEKRMLEEEGLVRYKDGWAKPEEVAYLRMGWEKSDKGEWLKPGEAERLAKEASLREQGWVQQQDMTWVGPDEVANWEKGLWKVEDRWVPANEANAYHSQIGRWWTYPSDQFVTLSTLDWDTTRWAGWYADQVFKDCVRAYGLQPDEKPQLIVVNSVAQYNSFATGDQTAQRPPGEIDGTSSCHYSFFAEAWFTVDEGGQPTYGGAGTAYWDVGDPNLKAYGQHAVRHAAAQSYAEAIDPSWDTVSRAMEAEGGQLSTAAFWAEKKIPRWFRYGVASYVERYFADPNADNAWWAREWGLANLRAAGDLRSFDDVFGMRLDPATPEASGQLIHNAGLYVAFILDGQVAPVVQAHRAFKTALRSGQGLEEAITGLETALREHEGELREFAGIPKPEKKAETAATGG